MRANIHKLFGNAKFLRIFSCESLKIIYFFGQVR